MSKNICSKTQLADKLSQKTKGLSKTKAFDIIGNLTDIITYDLSHKVDVRLMGFGSFKVRHRKARKGRNPQTGKQITIPAKNHVLFSNGRGLKKAINKK